MRRAIGRLLPAAALLATPAAAVLVVLVAARQLAPLPALIGLVVCFLLVAALLRPYLLDLDATADFLRRANPGEAQPQPKLHRAGPAEEILSGAARMMRIYAQRYTGMEAQIASLDTVLESIPYPLFMLNDQRRVLRTNLAARRLFGRELSGKDLAGVLRDPVLLEACDEVLSGSSGKVAEFSLPVPVEREMKALVEPLPMRIVDGSVAVLALHDITDVKRAEQMRADFVANASHELRTPLATLLGFIETLRGSARDDAEARERFLGIMFDQGSRMARLINDLLSLSRIELNEHTQPQGKLNLATLITSMAESLELQAKARRMEIRLNFAEDLPAILGQEDELTQVFQNLLDNALKYGREDTPIEITAKRATKLPASLVQKLEFGAVAVSVRDHSEGIPREHLPRLTERFFRVDTARSRKMGGTGLGLAIVKHVVNRHRGALHIDSTPGEGSTFTVFLPAARDSATDTPRIAVAKVVGGV